MIKSLLAANKSERDSFFIPKSVQQSIPIRRMYGDGIWQVGRRHSRTWRFADVNYAAASEDEQRSIFLSYGGVLNSLPTDAAAKVTIINRRFDPVNFQRTILLKEHGDGLDKYRREANQILTQRAAESNNLVQEKYITLSIAQRKIEETRSYFRRWTATCPRVLAAWTPGRGPSPTMTGSASSMTSSAPARRRISPLTRAPASAGGWTSGTSFARTGFRSNPATSRWGTRWAASYS